MVVVMVVCGGDDSGVFSNMWNVGDDCSYSVTDVLTLVCDDDDASGWSCKGVRKVA